MTEAILRMGNVELRTTDPLTCRTLFRLINTAVKPEDMGDVVDVPAGVDMCHLSAALSQ
jgi:hypothetical protein